MPTSKPPEEASPDIAADWLALRDDITKLTASVSELVRAEATATSDTVLGAVNDVRQKFSEQTTDVKDRLSGAGSDLETAIQRNPLMAMLIAMVAGLLIGLLSRPHK
jgi:ElaB/YqjD/DUF883 family membrane-anchored ribosome-binding protein